MALCGSRQTHGTITGSDMILLRISLVAEWPEHWQPLSQRPLTWPRPCSTPKSLAPSPRRQWRRIWWGNGMYDVAQRGLAWFDALCLESMGKWVVWCHFPALSGRHCRGREMWNNTGPLGWTCTSPCPVMDVPQIHCWCLQCAGYNLLHERNSWLLERPRGPCFVCCSRYCY